MITKQQFLEKVDEIDAEQPTSRLGGYGADGTCDCIGLGIGALRRAGESWPGTHGSNFAAREEVHDLRRITSVSDLQIGDVVFKARAKGESGWDLPEKYWKGKDLNDYYHFGIVRGLDPLDIVHCTTPTVKHDNKLGKWNYTAKLNRVEDDWREDEREDEGMAKIAKIDRPEGTEGSTVNVRIGAGKQTKLVGRVPFGEIVEVLSDLGDWCQIKTKSGMKGWVMANYILYEGEDIGDDDPLTPEIRQRLAEIDQALTNAQKNLNAILDIAGRG